MKVVAFVVAGILVGWVSTVLLGMPFYVSRAISKAIGVEE